jgi:hypothetical protein
MEQASQINKLISFKKYLITQIGNGVFPFELVVYIFNLLNQLIEMSKIIRICLLPEHIKSWNVKMSLYANFYSGYYKHVNKVYSQQDKDDKNNADLSQTFLVIRPYTSEEIIKKYMAVLKEHNIRTYYQHLKGLGDNAYLVVFMNENVDIDSAIVYARKLYSFVA